jgi:hypothetical protein
VNFYSLPNSADSSLINPGNNAKLIRINSITLDYFFEDHRIDRSCGTILLKMDAEGFEPEILYSGSNALKLIRYLAIDTGPERNGKTTTLEVSRILKDANFKILSTEKDVILAINLNK